MSMNIQLFDAVSGCDCPLYQTPTVDTYFILDGFGNDGKLERYLQWWKENRLDGRKRLNKMDQADYDDHKAKIERFLAGHPNAKWSAI